jgi:hypothetical protein
MASRSAPGTRYSELTSFEVIPIFQEHAMSANVGSIDRIIRILAGLALVAWALMGGPVWAWIGVLPLATGVLRICPAYSLLGVNTCGATK